MTLETDVGSIRHHKTKRDEREFRLVYACIFAISLVSAVFSRLMTRRRVSRDDTDKSIIQEARTRTCRFVPFFFMG
jgi:hypothetical protein